MSSSTAPDFSKPSLDSTPIPAVDQTYGVQGIKLDTHLSQLEGLVFFEQRGNVKVYTRPNDSLKVGLATIDHIEYGFIEDELSIIFLGFNDEINGNNLRNVFSKVYGRGFGTDKLVVWKGLKAEIIYTVKSEGSGYLSFSKIDFTVSDTLS